jgi:hypothetical protein
MGIVAVFRVHGLFMRRAVRERLTKLRELNSE